MVSMARPPRSAWTLEVRPRSRPGKRVSLRSRLRRAPQSGSPQDGFIDAATGTTCGQLALDDHRGNRTDAKAFGTLGHLDLSHVVNDHLTRGARGAPDDLDRLMAGRASGTEHFDLSLRGHLLGPIHLGSATAERQPTAARWQTLPLGGTSQVKRGVAGLKRETEGTGLAIPGMPIGNVRIFATVGVYMYVRGTNRSP